MLNNMLKAILEDNATAFGKAFDETLAEKIEHKTAELIEEYSENHDGLSEAVKMNSKVKLHAPGKDYHDVIGIVKEIRPRTYGSMKPSYTVDYQVGDRTASVTLPKSNLKLHKTE